MRGTSLLRECHPSKKGNFLKMLSIISGMTPICLKSVLIKSSGGVYLVRKPLISSRLATLDQPEVTIDLITLPERRCVSGQEAIDILKACHSGPTGGHH
uniref:Reverse transcriptase domain-containing protein n=1 Tax=Tanacetum cinerariifolium TaxID=118510 RepID=A0A699KJV8_TANCI|nr:reverse transcriptase domain-containing protein [Tanacetum cinerariifolium]